MLFCYTIHALIWHSSPSTPFKYSIGQVLEHPAHSANLAPSDFHLFEPIKNALRGHRFVGDDQVKRAMSGFINNQKLFFQRHQEACKLLG
jgi:hypothetical protein